MNLNRHTIERERRMEEGDEWGGAEQ